MVSLLCFINISELFPNIYIRMKSRYALLFALELCCLLWSFLRAAVVFESREERKARLVLVDWVLSFAM